MPVRDDPLGVGGQQVVDEPREHRPVGRSIALVRVEADEVDVAVVERVVRLGVGRNAAAFALCREREDLVVRSGLCGRIRRDAVVISERRPQHRRREDAWVRVEHGGLVFSLGAVGVCIVAEHQPDVGVGRSERA